MSDTWIPEGEDQVIEPDGTITDSPLDETPVADIPGVASDDHEPEKRVRLDVYHHFPDGVPLRLDLGALNLGIDVTGAVNVTVVEPTPTAPVATSAVIIIKSTTGETNMPGTITVDTTNETATLEFTDDHGDTDAAAPSNASGPAVVAFASSETTVATVAAGNPAAITPVAEGTTDISVTLTYPDGSEVFEADGVTPFPVPTPVTVTVQPGAATGDALVLSV